MSFRNDFEWAQRFMPDVKQHIGPLLLEEASLDRDQSEATDLIVLTARDMRIGVRIRRPGYAERYPNEFTIRAYRDSGAQTELGKIINGWGDWLFYGHAMDGASVRVCPWMVVDLKRLRSLWIRHPLREALADAKWCGRKSNGDGTHFVWFDVSRMPSDILVGQGGATCP